MNTKQSGKKSKRKIVSTFEIMCFGGPVVIDEPFEVEAMVRIHETGKTFPVLITPLPRTVKNVKENK